MTMCKVLVTGDRRWNCRILADRIVRRLRRKFGESLVILHGAATGIDSAFEASARRYGVRTEPHPAAWDDVGAPGAVVKYRADGKPYNAAAGPLRNRAMLLAEPAFCVACHRNLAWSLGTRDMVEQCLDAGVPVYLIDSQDGDPRRLRSKADI